MRRTIFYSLFLILVFGPGYIAASISTPIGFKLYTIIPQEVSRNEGVAPLSVFFTAGFNPSPATERSFHDYEYSWNFGDNIAGSWKASGKSKNEDKGPVTAHVFEEPGSYTVTLTVKNASGITVEVKQFAITVTDPDTVYSGTNTTCISDATSKDFTGCPSGAALVATNDIKQMTSYIGAGKRVLLRRGSSWTYSANISFPSGSGGPVTLGAYGTGDKPHLIATSAVGRFISVEYKNNWRIMDLHISGPGNSNTGLSGKTAMDHMLIMRNDIDGWDYGFSISHWRTDDTEGNKVRNLFLIENTVEAEATISAYVGAENLAILGNDMKGGGQHTLRVYQSYVGVISHNFLSGAGHNATVATGYGGHTLKFHGPDEAKIGTFAETGNTGFEYRTKFNVIANNVFGGAGDYQVTVGPQSTAIDHDERLADIIIEDNRFLADYGMQNKTIRRGLFATGSYYSVRRNIFDGAGSTGGYIGILLGGNYDAPTEGHVVTDNKVYRGDILSTTFDEYGVVVSASISDSVVQNNYVSFPNSKGNKLAVSNSSSSTTLINNILTDDPQFVNPDDPDPLLRDFSLIEGE